MSKKKKRLTGRNRRSRLRLFHAGNTRCPICLSVFTSSDVTAGKVTLEHAPPESLKGSAICLTCSQCNNNASHVDQHAILSKRAFDDWSAGKGARVEIDFLGFKTSSRYIPSDPKSPLPTQVRQLHGGSIKLDTLPPKEKLDVNKGIRFRIPSSPHYDSVSMIKSAYLMVFSLMGEGGYKFAESVALQPVREQIMNPKKKILKGGFVVKGTVPGTKETNHQMVFLCYAARPPLWIIPMWDEKVVLLPCGGPEPIDKFVAPMDEIKKAPVDEIKIETYHLTGWTACRFDESAGITGSVGGEPDIVDRALIGTIGLVPTDKGDWEWMIVDHHKGQYVALPFRHANENPRANSLSVVQVLGDRSVKGRGLDKSALARLNFGEWSKDMTINVNVEKEK